MPDGSVSWRIDGLRELQQKLSQLPPKFQRNALRQAVGAGARIIRDDARSRIHNAPHWEPEKSGLFRKGITESPGILRRAIRYTISVKQSIGLATATLFVSATGWWGAMVEHGTLPHLIFGGELARSRNYYTRKAIFGKKRFQERSGGKQAQALNILGNFVSKVDHPGARPKPFMKPAVDARYNDAVNAMVEKLRAFFDNFR